MKISDRLKDFITSIIAGLGFLSVISPLSLYWFIHGSYDRYIWIISGPYPFSRLGGGPFQFFMGVGLFLTGAVLLLISYLIKNHKIR